MMKNGTVRAGGVLPGIHTVHSPIRFHSRKSFGDTSKVQEINYLVDDMAKSGEVPVENLNDAIKDAKDEIAKLRAEGRDKGAEALEKVLEKLEDAVSEGFENTTEDPDSDWG